jgi:desulfoferrodoxin-like iron-binding protein
LEEEDQNRRLGKESQEPINSMTVFNQKEDFMAEKNQVYKCTMCGNIVEVLHGGTGKLSCCGQLMILLKDEEAKKAKRT